MTILLGSAPGKTNMEQGTAGPSDSATDGRKPGKERRVESLGWITESSVMPKKQRAIEGVGASSIVELRAQLYRTQEDARRSKEGDVDLQSKKSGRKKNGIKDILERPNAGVEERASRDKLQLKAATDGSESYAALEKKAELYEKLVRGEVPDEEEKEKYCVNFLYKGSLEDEGREMESERRGERGHDGEGEESRGDPSSPEAKGGFGGNSIRQQKHKQLIREVNQETKEAREKAVLLKQRRQQVADRNRQRLRQEFLKKKVEELKAKGRLSSRPPGDVQPGT